MAPPAFDWDSLELILIPIEKLEFPMEGMSADHLYHRIDDPIHVIYQYGRHRVVNGRHRVLTRFVMGDTHIEARIWVA